MHSANINILKYLDTCLTNHDEKPWALTVVKSTSGIFGEAQRG